MIGSYSFRLAIKGVGETVRAVRGLIANIRQPFSEAFTHWVWQTKLPPPSFLIFQLAISCNLSVLFPLRLYHDWLRATSWCLSIVLHVRPAAWWNKHFTLCSDTDDISFVCFVWSSRFWWNGLFSFVWLPACVDVSVRGKSVAYFSIRLRQMAFEIESVQQGSTVLFSTQIVVLIISKSCRTDLKNPNLSQFLFVLTGISPCEQVMCFKGFFTKQMFHLLITHP